MLRRLALLLLLLTPVAAAQETLASLEEPHSGTDKIWDVVVQEDEAGEQRALVFRNPVGRSFSLVIYDGDGAEIFIRNGTRGIQTLPALEAGPHRFFVRGEGEFQVTEKAFERILSATDVNATLNGTDAYVVAPSRPYDVLIEGGVRVEWWPLAGAPEDLSTPVNRSAVPGNAYVITLRGEPGTPYRIALVGGALPPAPSNETPGLAILALFATVALLAALKRRT